MYKKSITRIEKENESSQVELSNPALQDIIATNHIVLAKKPHEERLSRACKAAVIMIIFGVVAIGIGIVVLTLVLAHSRNSFMATISRFGEANYLSTSNNSRIHFVHQENLTTISNENKDDDNWQKITVSLTSNNLHRVTTQNVHISSSIMRTQQQNEHISSNTQSMKPYPSLNTMVNEQSTISTTIQTVMTNQQTTFIPSSHHSTIIMTAENELMTTIDDQEHIQTSSTNEMTSVVNNTPTLIEDNITSIPEETSFTTFINRHFNFQSSTIVNNDKNKKNQFARNFTNDEEEEDIMNDVLFS